MKKIGNCLYFHSSSINSVVGEDIREALNRTLPLLPWKFKEFTVCKYNKKDKSISFIISNDFDTANEPEIHAVLNIKENGEIKGFNGRGQIYHHKWQFVNDDYTGFNIKEAKSRSLLWENIIPKTRTIKSRIGYKKYWEELLKSYNIPL